MRFGIVSTSLATTGLSQTFSSAAQVGAEGLELSYPAENDLQALYQPDHATELADLCRKHQITLEALRLDSFCSQPSLILDPKRIANSVEVALQAISVATEAGAEKIVLPFFGKNTIELDEELVLAADALLELVDPAANAGVEVAIQSTLNFSQQQFLLDHLGKTGDVKIALDTGVATARRLDLPTGIRRLSGESIAKVSLKDVRLVEGQPPDYALPLGAGDVNFEAAAQAIRAVRYDGWIVVDTPAGDDPLAAATRNLQFARDVLSQRR